MRSVIRCVWPLACAAAIVGCQGQRESEAPSSEEPTAASVASAKDAPKGDADEVTPKLVGTPGKLSPGPLALAGAATLAVERAALGEKDVSWMGWRGDRLELGFHDGALGELAPKQGETMSLAQLAPGSKDILATSPDGAILVTRGAKGDAHVVHRDTHSDLLVFPDSVRVEGAAFSPDGKAMFVSDASGKVRVWKDAPSLSALAGDQPKLQEYVTMLNGDFRANFGPMKGAIWSADGPSFIYSDPNGQLVHWSMKTPTEASYVVRIDGPPTSAALAGEHVFVTSAKGELRVSNLATGGMLMWSRGARADHVGADDADPGLFVAQEGGKVRLAKTKTGESTWEVDLGPGRACGVEPSAKAGLVAACVGQRVHVLALADGTTRAVARRDGAVVRFE